MNRKFFFLLLISLWFLMIFSYVVYKEFSLRFGTEVTLKVVPVDPRDIFRGDYVILTYEISEVSPEQKILFDDSFYGETNLYSGDTVYVELIKDGNFHKGGNIYTAKPAKGLFIKGKIQTNQRNFDLINNIETIIYGIENYFVPEDEGKALEDARNRDRVSAAVSVNRYGTASLKNLYIDDKKVDFKNKNE